MRPYTWIKLIEHSKEIDELKAQVSKLSNMLWEIKQELDKKKYWVDKPWGDYK